MNILSVSYQDPRASEKFSESLRSTGFAVLSNHPIPQSLIEDVYGEWNQFFNSDSKFDYVFDPGTQAGFFPYKSENAKDAAEKDLKEFYHVYDGQKFPQTLSSKTLVLKKALYNLGRELLNWIEENSPSEVQKNYRIPLAKMAEGSPKNLFRVIHYPPLSGNEEPNAVRAAAHEDINLITLLPASTAMGLEVKDAEGKWHEVGGDFGDIVVNVGDMLQEASRGYFKSTTHRVKNPTGDWASKPRYSMPLFVHPHEEVRLSDRYTAGEYLDERLREIGLAS